MMSAVKIQCPRAKALPFHGPVRVQNSAILLWCVPISLKEEKIARQRARPPYTARHVFLHILEMGTWDPAPTQLLPPAY